MSRWNFPSSNHTRLAGAAQASTASERVENEAVGDPIGEIRFEIGRLADILEEMKEIIKGQSKEYLTVAEIATLTARSEYTVRRWISEKKITAHRVGGTGPKGRLLIHRSEISRIVEMGNGRDVSGLAAAAAAK